MNNYVDYKALTANLIKGWLHGKQCFKTVENKQKLAEFKVKPTESYQTNERQNIKPATRDNIYLRQLKEIGVH